MSAISQNIRGCCCPEKIRSSLLHLPLADPSDPEQFQTRRNSLTVGCDSGGGSGGQSGRGGFSSGRSSGPSSGRGIGHAIGHSFSRLFGHHNKAPSSAHDMAPPLAGATVLHGKVVQLPGPQIISSPARRRFPHRPINDFPFGDRFLLFPPRPGFGFADARASVFRATASSTMISTALPADSFSAHFSSVDFPGPLSAARHSCHSMIRGLITSLTIPR